MAAERLRRISDHLQPSDSICSGSMEGTTLSLVPCSSAVSSARGLAAVLRGKHDGVKDKIFTFFEKHPELLTPVEISKDKHRELSLAQLVAVVKEAGVKPLEALVEDPEKYYAITEAVGYIDISLAIKLGVQFSLWGGSVMNLGTRRHAARFFNPISELDMPGCFAMTELHHGSNVQALHTTATYDPASQEFIIHTPDEGAIKWWIGNAACHGKFATVFARLLLPSTAAAAKRGVEDMGVHAFVVQLRSLEDHSLMPGVDIKDCGYKVGLNGVDNGAIRFTHVRVPRENMLDRFGGVNVDGTYSSDLPTANKRFAAILGELVGGRVGLASGSVAVLKTCVTIATRYSLLRKQFGPGTPPHQAEISILDYPSQQQRLMPMLAASYAFHFASSRLVSMYGSMKKLRSAGAGASADTTGLTADVHALSAGLKAYITTYTQRAIGVCRECCGGHGYAAVNRFGAMRNDHDIFQTFEGDNTVLLQQVAADLLKHYKEKFASGAVSATVQYLQASMATYLTQTNPVATHRDSREHLRDSRFHLDAFQYRTAKLLHTAALRLSKHTPRLGSFGAWNRCLTHLLTLAESHIESVILASFIEAVKKCDNPPVQSKLRTLCHLYALDRIWQDIGTYRISDYVAPNKAKAIHRQLEQLCIDVKGISCEAIDAFGIPDALLRAPIGLQADQYAEYSQAVGF